MNFIFQLRICMITRLRWNIRDEGHDSRQSNPAMSFRSTRWRTTLSVRGTVSYGWRDMLSVHSLKQRRIISHCPQYVTKYPERAHKARLRGAFREPTTSKPTRAVNRALKPKRNVPAAREGGLPLRHFGWRRSAQLKSTQSRGEAPPAETASPVRAVKN